MATVPRSLISIRRWSASRRPAIWHVQQAGGRTCTCSTHLARAPPLVGAGLQDVGQQVMQAGRQLQAVGEGVLRREDEGGGRRGRGSNWQRDEAKMWMVVSERICRQAPWQLVRAAALAVGWTAGQGMPATHACLGLHDVLQAVPPAGGPGEAARHLQGGWQQREVWMG